jgi:hypothetical protein
MRLVGVAGDRLLASADAIGGAVTALGALGSGTVELHELRVVDVVAESLLDSFEVGAMAVSRKLDAVREPGPQVIHQRQGVIKSRPQKPRHKGGQGGTQWWSANGSGPVSLLAWSPGPSLLFRLDGLKADCSGRGIARTTLECPPLRG